MNWEKVWTGLSTLSRISKFSRQRQEVKKGSNRRQGISPKSERTSSLKPNSRISEDHSRAPFYLPAVTGPADALIMGTVIALVAFGVVMVYSSSAVYAYQEFKSGQHFLIRQSIYAAIGLPLVMFLARFDYHNIRPLTYPFLLISIILVFITATGLGRSGGGAARWINLGPINIQPAEIAKLSLICWLAYSLSKKSEVIRTFSIGFLPHILMAMILMVLCLRQPDFGSAVMIGMLTFILLFTAGAKMAYIFAAIIFVSPFAYYLIAGSEYRMRRITAFLEPFKYRYDAGYQIAESLMSYGSGGLTGVGIGDSRQKLFFLPEAHTDFISAIIGEELGFVGILIVVLAFLLIAYRGFGIALKATDVYGTYLAVGITLFIGMQAMTNLAVSVGLLPTKGLVLPFISYGGSALLVNCAAIGILLNISREREKPVNTKDSYSSSKKNYSWSITQGRVV